MTYQIDRTSPLYSWIFGSAELCTMGARIVFRLDDVSESYSCDSLAVSSDFKLVGAYRLSGMNMAKDQIEKAELEEEESVKRHQQYQIGTGSVPCVRVWLWQRVGSGRIGSGRIARAGGVARRAGLSRALFASGRPVAASSSETLKLNRNE